MVLSARTQNGLPGDPWRSLDASCRECMVGGDWNMAVLMGYNSVFNGV